MKTQSHVIAFVDSQTGGTNHRNFNNFRILRNCETRKNQNFLNSYLYEHLLLAFFGLKLHCFIKRSIIDKIKLKTLAVLVIFELKNKWL